MQNRAIGVRMLKRAVFTTAVAGLLAGQLLTAQTASSPQVVARAEAPPETTTTGPSSPTSSSQQSELGVVDELNAMKTSGLLTRMSLAWSRDGDKKFYVQDRMREVGRELWTWLAEGANVYICGDAKRMAKDVERALVDIVAQFGARSTDEAVSFVAELKKKGRFQQDVY